MKKLTNSTALTLASIAATTPAQAATWTSISDYRDSAGTIVGIILIAAFVACLILWLVGTLTKEQSPGASKWCFQAVWYVAIGFPLISLLFYTFVGGGAVATPKFD